MQSEWKKVKLSDVCEYVKDKISVNILNETTYISTENMLPNKNGITFATSLPKVNLTQGFKKGDILISNIRPYFKKIWYAKFDAGCSNDVLVLRAKNGIDSNFLYYVLSDDNFFYYSMLTSKGTKMPRGDKQAIMDYEVPNISYETQKKIVSILKPIDDKIELNRAVNENLELQAQAIFKNWFVDFAPFGGTMPSDWKVSNLGQIAFIKTDSWSPVKNQNEVIEHYSIPAFDEQHYPIFEVANNIKSNKYILTSHSVMISKLNPETKRIWRPMCISANPVCSTEFIVYEAKNNKYKDYIYSIIDSLKFLNYLCSHATGTTNSRQRVIPKTTLEFPVLLASDSVIMEFCKIVTPIYNLINSNIIENQLLKHFRDTLLPRLMSGELDVSNIELKFKSNSHLFSD